MEKHYYLGLDVGGTDLCAGVVDSDCNIISKVSIPSGVERSIECIQYSPRYPGQCAD